MGIERTPPVLAGTGTVTQVASSATVVNLLVANVGRLGVVIENVSTAILYVKFGATATTTSFTYLMAANTRLDLRQARVEYTGLITGIWASANGNAYVTELTA